MKKTVAIITACLFLFCSCDMNGDYLAYQRGGISCELDFTSDGREYSASLALSPMPEAGERDLELVFTSPATLKGVAVKREGGASFVELDGMKIPLPSAALTGFAEIADAFSISGTLDAIETKDGVNRLYIISDKGRYAVFLDPEKKQPLKIEADTGFRSLDIVIKNFMSK